MSNKVVVLLLKKMMEIYFTFIMGKPPSWERPHTGKAPCYHQTKWSHPAVWCKFDVMILFCISFSVARSVQYMDI